MLIKTQKFSKETERIIKTALANKRFSKALQMATGGNPRLAEMKLMAIAGALENARSRNLFSTPATGTWNFPNFGTVLELASVLALVTSFSGYLTIERALAQPNAVEYFLDITSVEGANPPAKFPAVGPTQYSSNSLANQIAQLPSVTVTPGNSTPLLFTAGGASPVGHVFVPYTIEITLVVTVNSTPPSTTVYKIHDNGTGSLVLPADLISGGPIQITAATLNYGSYSVSTPTAGSFSLTIANPAAATSSVTVTGSVRYATSYIDDNTYPGVGQLNDTRFKFDLTRHIEVHTKPSQLVVEWNLVDIAQSQKSLNVDLAAVLTERITDMYTKILNRFITRVYADQLYEGAPETVIDVSSPLGASAPVTATWNQYLPILDRIASEMEGVFMKLYNKSYIGAQPTALLVSPRMLGYLRRMKVIDPALWTDEKSSYINNLQGYFRGIPVLVHTDLAAVFDRRYNAAGPNPTWMPPITVSGNTYEYYTCGGFAVHVRDDASLAPAFHGIFLPPTEAPIVSNFNNITQQARGIFYMQEVVPLAPELVVPFAFVGLPVD